MSRFDRTENVKSHLLAAAKTLRDEAEAIERDVARTNTIDEAESIANYAITRFAFAAANAMASITSANNWADEHRKMEIITLKEDANRLTAKLDELKNGPYE